MFERVICAVAGHRYVVGCFGIWSGNSDGYTKIELPKKDDDPQRPALTDEDIDRVTIACFGPNADLEFHRHHARAVEAEVRKRVGVQR